MAVRVGVSAISFWEIAMLKTGDGSDSLKTSAYGVVSNWQGMVEIAVDGEIGIRAISLAVPTLPIV